MNGPMVSVIRAGPGASQVSLSPAQRDSGALQGFPSRRKVRVQLPGSPSPDKGLLPGSRVHDTQAKLPSWV